MFRILIPPNSRRRKYLKKMIDRRRLNTKKRHYNAQRVAYYKNSTRLSLKTGPLISVVVPAYNTPVKYLEPLLSGVYSQGYENWELVIVDASTDRIISKNIAQKAKSDTRIKYIKHNNGGIAANTNVGIKESRGDFIAFLDHDDVLDPDALARAMQQFDKHPDLDLVYSDEDKITENGETYLLPHYKPDFSLDMLRSVNYITHFVVVKATIAKNLLIREGFEGAQDYDFLLRVVDSGAKVGHAPGISYHWRQTPNSTAADFSNKEHITGAGVKALNDHYERRSISNAKAEAIKGMPGFYRTNYDTKDNKKRAIYITLKREEGRGSAIEKLIADILKKNKDVIKNGYEVLTSTDNKLSAKKYSSILYINDIVIPSSDDATISNLFALAEEEGVFGVSPRIVSSGQIYDLGLVKHDGLLVPLARNVSPRDFSIYGSVFGYHEWSRNVEGLTGKVFAVSSDEKGDFTSVESVSRASIKSQLRKIICGDVEFTKLYSTSDGQVPEGPNYYNDDLSFEYKPTISSKKYVEEVVDVE